MAAIDTLGNIFEDVAIKAPVRAATTGAITLSGLQTIDGVALTAGDRVLVKNQADTRTNGLYRASTGIWQRTFDVSKSTDLIDATQVGVARGTVNTGVIFALRCTDSPVVIGTSLLVWQSITLTSLSTINVTAPLTGGGSLATNPTIGLDSGATFAVVGTQLRTIAGTGDVTWSANSFATTIAAHAVTNSKFRQGAGLSVVGVTGSATADVDDITGTASQFLGVNAAGTALAFQTMGGDATLSGGTLTLGAHVVSSAKFRQGAARSVVANATNALANVDDLASSAGGQILNSTATTLAWSATPTLGVAGSTLGTIAFAGNTSGTTTLQPAAAASGTLTLPAATDTLIGKATADVLTNKTYDTAGSGNVFKINGTAISAVTGTGAAVLANTPTLITPALGVATATSINGLALTASTGTLTIANGKTLTASNSITIAGTDGKTLTVSNSLTFTGTDGSTIAFPLTVANGGTGAVTLTSHGVLIGAGTGAITQLAAAAAGTLLAGGGASSDPAFTATPTLGIAGTTLGTLSLSGNTAGTVTIRPAANTGNWTMTLPTTAGSGSQVLSTDGTGVTSWASIAGSTIASEAQAEAGTDNTTVMSPLRTAQSFIGNVLTFKNLVGRNGALQVWQRGTSVSVAASTTAYTADGWYLKTGANQGFTVSQGGTLVNGIQFNATVQRNNGQTGTSTVYFAIPLDTDEIYRMRGNALVLSFYTATGANWSPTSGTLTYNLYVGTGAVGKRNSVAFTGETNPITGSVNLATGASAARTISAISAAVGVSITQAELQFSFTPSGTAGAADSVSIAAVQLEVVPAGIAAVVPVFEKTDYEWDLHRCQRFYERVGGASQSIFCDVYSNGGNTAITTWYFKVNKHAIPTIAVSGSLTTLNTTGSLQSTPDFTHTALYYVAAGTGRTFWYNDPASYITASAEI
jgi:hypothetical protein